MFDFLTDSELEQKAIDAMIDYFKTGNRFIYAFVKGYIEEIDYRKLSAFRYRLNKQWYGS